MSHLMGGYFDGLKELQVLAYTNAPPAAHGITECVTMETGIRFRNV